MVEVNVDQRAEADATLLALLANRERGESVASLVAEVYHDGHPDEAWAARHPADLLGAPADHLLDGARAQLASWRGQGHRYVSILDAEYPRRLRTVHDAPPFLFYRGNLATLQSGGVSVVGSREVSPEGLERAAGVARYLVEQGLTVISGLARGVDFAAHTATLQAGGQPLGVIATGIAAPYTPASSRELHEAVAGRGALVSQFMPDAHAQKFTFLQRNATMSGLGLATVVIEAGEHSGARAQARLAMEHGRPVILADRVVEGTTWGRSLADGRRSNVYVVSTLDDVRSAITKVTAMTSLERLDSVLAASL